MHGLSDGFLADKPRFAAHAAEVLAFVRDAEIVLAQGADETALLNLSTLKPRTAARIGAVLAAVGAAWAQQVPFELICAGLRTFDAPAQPGAD